MRKSSHKVIVVATITILAIILFLLPSNDRIFIQLCVEYQIL